MSTNRSSFGYDDNKRSTFPSFSTSLSSSILQSSSKRSSMNDIDAFVAKFSSSSYAEGLRDRNLPNVRPTIPRIDSSTLKSSAGRTGLFLDSFKSHSKFDDFRSSKFKASYPARPPSPVPTGFFRETSDGRRSPNIFQSRSESFDKRDPYRIRDSEPSVSESYKRSSGYERDSHKLGYDGSNARKHDSEYSYKAKIEDGHRMGKLSFDVDREMGPPKRRSPVGQHSSPPKRRRENSPDRNEPSSSSLHSSSGKWMLATAQPSDRPTDYYSNRLKENDSVSGSYHDRAGPEPWKRDERKIVDWGDPKVGANRSRPEVGRDDPPWSGRRDVLHSGRGYDDRRDSRLSSSQAAQSLPVPPPPPVLSSNLPYPVTDYSEPLPPSGQAAPVISRNAKNTIHVDREGDSSFSKVSSRFEGAKVNPQIIEQCKQKIRELYKMRTAEPGAFFPIFRPQQIDNNLSPLAFRQRLSLQFNTQPSADKLWKSAVVEEIEKAVEEKEQQKKYMPSSKSLTSKIINTGCEMEIKRPAIENKFHDSQASAMRTYGTESREGYNYVSQPFVEQANSDSWSWMKTTDSSDLNPTSQIPSLMPKYEHSQSRMLLEVPIVPKQKSPPRETFATPLTGHGIPKSVPRHGYNWGKNVPQQTSQRDSDVKHVWKRPPEESVQNVSQYPLNDKRGRLESDDDDVVFVSEVPMSQASEPKIPKLQDDKGIKLNLKPRNRLSGMMTATAGFQANQPLTATNVAPPTSIRHANPDRPNLQTIVCQDTVINYKNSSTPSSMTTISEAPWNTNSKPASSQFDNTVTKVQKPKVEAQKKDISAVPKLASAPVVSKTVGPNESKHASPAITPGTKAGTQSSNIASVVKQPQEVSNKSEAHPVSGKKEPLVKIKSFSQVFEVLCELSQKISSLQQSKIKFYADVKRGVYPSQKYSVINGILCFKINPSANPAITSFTINDEMIDIVHEFFNHKVSVKFLTSVLKDHFYGISNYANRIAAVVKNCPLCSEGNGQQGQENVIEKPRTDKGELGNTSKTKDSRSVQSTSDVSSLSSQGKSNTNPMASPTTPKLIAKVQTNQGKNAETPKSTASSQKTPNLPKNLANQANAKSSPSLPGPKVSSQPSQVSTSQKQVLPLSKGSDPVNTVLKSASQTSSGSPVAIKNTQSLPSGQKSEQWSVFNIPETLTKTISDLQIKNIKYYSEVKQGKYYNPKYFISRGLLCFRNNDKSKSYIVSLSINEQIIMLIHEYLNHSDDVNLHVEKIRQLCAGIADVNAKVARAVANCALCTKKKIANPSAVEAPPQNVKSGDQKPSQQDVSMKSAEQSSPATRPVNTTQAKVPENSKPAVTKAGGNVQTSASNLQDKSKHLSCFDTILDCESELSKQLAELQSSKIPIYHSVSKGRCNISNYVIINKILCFKFSSTESPLITTDGIADKIITLIHDYGHNAKISDQLNVLKKYFCHVSDAEKKLIQLTNNCSHCISGKNKPANSGNKANETSKSQINFQADKNKNSDGNDSLKSVRTIVKPVPRSPLPASSVMKTAQSTGVAKVNTQLLPKAPITKASTQVPPKMTPQSKGDTPQSHNQSLKKAPQTKSELQYPQKTPQIKADTKELPKTPQRKEVQSSPKTSLIKTDSPTIPQSPGNKSVVQVSPVTTKKTASPANNSAGGSVSVIDKVKKIQSQSEVCTKLICELKTGLQDFTFRGNLLLKKCTIGSSKMLKMYLPEDKLTEIIGICHKDFSAHGPENNVLALLEKHFSPAPNLPELVKEYISNCTECN